MLYNSTKAQQPGDNMLDSCCRDNDSESNISSLPSGAPSASIGGSSRPVTSPGPHKVASDHTLAEKGAGKPIKLERNNTLRIDQIGEMRRDSDMHVFSAHYHTYALPKRQ